MAVIVSMVLNSVDQVANFRQVAALFSAWLDMPLHRAGGGVKIVPRLRELITLLGWRCAVMMKEHFYGRQGGAHAHRLKVLIAWRFNTDLLRWPPAWDTGLYRALNNW